MAPWGSWTRLDRTQRKRSFLGFPVATFFKFIDDQGPYLSAIISFYALIAIFPLLLLATTIFGFILQGNPDLQEQVLDSALSTFPIIGDELGRPEGLTGSKVSTVVGVLTAIYGSMGLGQALQNALNVAWSVPRNQRPNPVRLRLKSLALLAIVGTSVLAIAIVSTLGSETEVFGPRLDTTLQMGRPAGHRAADRARSSLWCSGSPPPADTTSGAPRRARSRSPCSGRGCSTSAPCTRPGSWPRPRG